MAQLRLTIIAVTISLVFEIWRFQNLFLLENFFLVQIPRRSHMIGEAAEIRDGVEIAPCHRQSARKFEFDKLQVSC